MKQLIYKLFILIIALINIGCGFKLRNSMFVPKQIKTMIIESVEPYNPLTRSVIQELHVHGINVISDTKYVHNKYPILYLGTEMIERKTTSVFINNTVAESLLTMTVTGKIMIPYKGIYPINANTYHYVFDEPNTILAKDVEQETLFQEMRQIISSQLLRKIIILCNNQEYQSKLLNSKRVKTK
ncbi:LPS assembly lipoprotein LptE [Pantoea sp. Aalb]|uniref:LPS assembly lipoprotein LptE n=1 Tax=Pantoea sp. Aalb TaxID=2576762 RepID=UPI001356B543|nr:LPS assembly lipoprotein LptE [Pantoea sp. Aalb]